MADPNLRLDAEGAVRLDRYDDLRESLPWGCLMLEAWGHILEIDKTTAPSMCPMPGGFAGLSWLTSLRNPRTAEIESAPAVDGPHDAHIALRRVADEMRDLYQNAPCGYHSLDHDGVVRRINSTELRWLRYRREEIVGRRRFTEVVAANCRAGFERYFAALKSGHRVHDLQIDLTRRSGAAFPVLLRATAVTDGHGRFVESRASVFDITQRKIAEDEAQRYARRLKAMSHRAAEVQETERRRLAQELHDRVGQNLTALSINLNILKGEIRASCPAGVFARLDDSLALVDATVVSIRDVMAELRPAVLDDYGLAAVLRWYAAEFTRRTGIATGVVGADPVPRLAADLEGTLFRIVQESLTNTAKHAGARTARIVLETPRANAFRLSVVDDGRGFDSKALGRTDSHHGWGLMIMRERAESTGAKLTVASSRGEGTRVIVELEA